MSAKESYDTLVVVGMGNDIPREIGGLRVAAWSAGNAIDDRSELEDFIRELSYGDIEDPQQAVIELMERGGWG